MSETPTAADMLTSLTRNAQLNMNTKETTNRKVTTRWTSQLEGMTIAITREELGPARVPMRHGSRSRAPSADFILSPAFSISFRPPTRQETNSRSCHPFPFGFSVDRVSRSRSVEWRNARDTSAPEIPPATRRDGSIVGLRARLVPDRE